MNRSVRWERRTSSTSQMGHRIVTQRPSFSPADEKLLMMNMQADNNNPTTILESQEPKKPFRVKKSELAPIDPSAPVFLQFGKIVKSGSMLLLKSIGQNKKELRESINDAYDEFFKQFDSWWRSSYRVSLRKVSEPIPPKGLLKNNYTICQDRIEPLRKQKVIWSKANDEIETEIPDPPIMQDYNINAQNEDDNDDIMDDIKKLITALDNLSIDTQQKKLDKTSVEETVDQVRDLIQNDIKIDNNRQKMLMTRLFDEK
ncbi:hypothetical protein TRFO_37920 [Tritrichomonas foetus]|uniref:Uncharacterized protein n=1 Tax=Tritrichomonas foetus TaxID=1144522 RepID=A0A1J4JES9_9EUKA|nr:hypothetical protein TRFO_37920 [Tritrichomonas foetus]|eukprot:OHS95949.1 hypothetical protein TRFO_37920 [Tritrichomonas foetus]